MKTELIPYHGESEAAAALIRGFWKVHNDYDPTDAEVLEDLQSWTKTGHAFYFIRFAGENVGFLHLGSRGCEADWLEDIFVQPQYQNRGIGSAAIALAETIVSSYSESLYIEAAARNEQAIRLYRKLGYDCLNTITVRKDFCPACHETTRQEEIYGQKFDIQKRRTECV